MTKNDVDLNIVVREDYEVKTTKYNGKYTKSTLFLLPMIELSVRNRLVSKYLKNAFIDDKGIQHDFAEPLFLLFKVKNLRERDWQDFCKVLLEIPETKEAHVMDYYVGKEKDHHLVMYVFQIPAKHITDYSNFICGKYSKFTKEFKAKFPEKIANAANEQVESLVWGAMHKSPHLKDLIAKEFNVEKTEHTQFRKYVDTFDEIWDSPKLNEEIYRYEPEQT